VRACTARVCTAWQTEGHKARVEGEFADVKAEAGNAKALLAEALQSLNVKAEENRSLSEHVQALLSAVDQAQQEARYAATHTPAVALAAVPAVPQPCVSRAPSCGRVPRVVRAERRM
jgi:hypothetical protein